jgi:hypothetical protein
MTLEDIRAILVSSIERKVHEAVREVSEQEDVYEEKCMMILIRRLLNDTDKDYKVYSEDTSSEIAIDSKKKVSDYSKLRELERKFVTRQAAEVEQGKGSVSLIAVQLVERVTALHEPIRVTRDKLRTITLTTDVILSIGGNPSCVTRETRAYDAANQKWTKTRSMHRKRSLAAATSWNGKVIVAGGQTEECKCDETVEEYDPISNSWSWLSSLLLGRSEHSLVNLNGCIFALGGCTKVEDEFDITSKVETLDGEDRQWTHGEPMIIGRSGFVAVAVAVSSTAYI